MRSQSSRTGAVEPKPGLARAPDAPTPGLTPLRYLQQAPIRVLGPATGRAYAFSGARPLQMVDSRDAEALGRAALFRLG